MAEEVEVGCARPTGGLVGEPSETEKSPQQEQLANNGKAARKMIQVGQKAPDFVAPAYHQGKFTSEKLSDHLGKWVVLCFYPGDFTYV